MKRILIASLLALAITSGAPAADKAEMTRQLKAAQAQLAQLRGTYSEKHPKVLSQSQRVQALEKQLKAAK